MTNRYYGSGESRAGRVRDLFSAIARRYDVLNDLQSFGLHRWWKRRLVRLAEVRPGERGLDVCCGTGDVAFRLGRKGVEVVGLDFSAAMLGVARRRADEAGLVEFCLGDAQALPFAEGSFDVATVAYGLRNLADWERGLREMWRVTRGGGRLLVLEFGKPRDAWWRLLYFGYLRCAVPLLGWLVAGNGQAYAYILESLRSYPAQSGVSEKLRQLGAEPVEVMNLLGGAMSIHTARKPGPFAVQPSRNPLR